MATPFHPFRSEHDKAAFHAFYRDGGWLSALYASQFPHRVRKAVLLAPGGAVCRLSLAFCLRVALLCVPIPGLRRRGGTLQRILRWMFADTFRTGEAGRAQMEWMTRQIDAGRFYARPRMAWPTVFSDQEWKRYRVPTLLVVVENERIYSPRKVIRRMNRVAPAVRSEIIPGAGHDLFVRVDLVIEKALAFLDEAVGEHPVGGDGGPPLQAWDCRPAWP